MATMLQDRDSSDKHLDYVRLHSRRCNKNKGTEFLAQRIKPLADTLSEKKVVTKQTIQNRQDANDDIKLEDTILDNEVRTVHEKCLQYDRDNLGHSVLTKIFPNGSFGWIVKLTEKEEPDEIDKLTIRIENLGSDHPLFPHAAILKEKANAVRNAIKAYNEAVTLQKSAEAEEEIAQASLRREYENNYLDARGQFGKAKAEMLFPFITYQPPAEPEVEAAAKSK